MERKIELKLVDNNHYWMKGIYLIRIGGKKYIGKSTCVGNRTREHQLAINRALKSYSYWKNFGFPTEDKRKSNASYMKVAQYLHENPEIISGTVEVLQRQICSNMLYFAEDFFLKEIYDSADCYNTAYGSTRPDPSKDNLWDAEVVENRIEYFDPRIKYLRVLSNKSNDYNKDIIKKINSVKKSKQYRVQRLGAKKDMLLEANPGRKGEVLTYILTEMNKINKGEI